MATADVTYHSVLHDAQQLMPEEQARLIDELERKLAAPHEPPSVTDKMAILDQIHERLHQSGYRRRTPEEVVAYIEEERNSWNNE